MSASHRSLARLPLGVFRDLTTAEEDPEALRRALVVKLRQASHKEAVTVGGLLRTSAPALLRAVDPLLTHEECSELVRRICALCAPRPVTLLSLYKDTPPSTTSLHQLPPDLCKYLKTGLFDLDNILRGGIRVGTLSEVTGVAGVGKTQLALQLCVQASKYHQGTVYIDTERKLRLERLQEMAEARAASDTTPRSTTASDDEGLPEEGGFSYNMSSSSVHHPEDPKQPPPAAEQQAGKLHYPPARTVLDNVTVHAPHSTLGLRATLAQVEEEILLRNNSDDTNDDGNNNKFPVRLVILDSIAAPVRRDFEHAPQRVAAVLNLAQTLKRMADQLQVAVVVINQVERTSKMEGVQAALGTSWHHCLSTRLVLESLDEGGFDSTTPPQVRRATVVKSQVAARASMKFQITTAGLQQVTSEDG